MFEKIDNFSRVVRPQAKHIVFPPQGRYTPIKHVLHLTQGVVSGFLLLKDKTPDVAEELVELSMPISMTAKKAIAAMAGLVLPGGESVATPQPFEFADAE